MRVIVTEQQFQKILMEGIGLHTAKEKDAREHTQQAEFPEKIKCPHCKKTDAMFQFSVCDGEGEGDEQIGRVGEDGKWDTTEFQAYAVYQCPKCFRSTALNNMA